MKLLLKVSLILFVLLATALGLSYQLPKEGVVEKTTLVAASPDQVFSYIENPTEWVRWNAWNKTYDPTLIQLYGGPMRGKGARLTWNGDKVGSRQMIFINSVSPETLQYEITRDKEEHKTIGSFTLEKVTGGTMVSWRENTPIEDSPIELVKGAWEQYKSDKEMEQGLLGLKTLMEQSSKRRATR